MESHGEPGKIQVSRATYQLLQEHFSFEARGKVNIKGKGLLETWFLVGRRPRPPSPPE
jgi:class 3 adenylate cyclase